ncbi:MAG: caspase family protein [Myxococcales bacterium]|nr:caspase family protein [Myxococcales bacterium]
MYRFFSPIFGANRKAKSGGLLFFLFAMLFSTQAWSVETRRFALVIGHNHGGDELEPLLYAERDALRVSQVLSELGGFRPQDVFLLRSPTLAQTKAAMTKLRRAVASSKNAMFFFYYSGHARSKKKLRVASFQLGKERLPFSTVYRFVRKLPVRFRLVVVDSCYSGEILHAKGTRAKGAVRDRSIEWSHEDFALRVKGLAVMASSGARERSFESNQLRGSFFTSNLLTGLRGAADSNEDLRVSLQEAFYYARQQTISLSLQHGPQIQRPTFLLNFHSEAPLFLTHIRRASSRLEFPKSLRGHVLLSKQQRLVDEFHKPSGVRRIVAVKPGIYDVVLYRKGWKAKSRVQILRKQRVVLTPQKLEMIPPSFHPFSREKGANGNLGRPLLFSLDYEPLNQLALHNIGFSLGTEITPWFRMSARYRYGLQSYQAGWTQGEEGYFYQAHSLGASFQIGYPIYWKRLRFFLGVGVEPSLHLRLYKASDVGAQLNLGAFLGPCFSTEVAISPEWSVRLNVSGGAHLVFYQGAVRTGAWLRSGIGLVWRP